MNDSGGPYERALIRDALVVPEMNRTDAEVARRETPHVEAKPAGGCRSTGLSPSLPPGENPGQSGSVAPPSGHFTALSVNVRLFTVLSKNCSIHGRRRGKGRPMYFAMCQLYTFSTFTMSKRAFE